MSLGMWVGSPAHLQFPWWPLLPSLSFQSPHSLFSFSLKAAWENLSCLPHLIHWLCCSGPFCFSGPWTFYSPSTGKIKVTHEATSTPVFTPMCSNFHISHSSREIPPQVLCVSSLPGTFFTLTFLWFRPNRCPWIVFFSECFSPPKVECHHNLTPLSWCMAF